MKNISILGVTGSIGTQTLDVIRKHKDDFKLIGISAHTNYIKVIEIIEEFKPTYICITDKETSFRVKEYCSSNGIIVEIFSGIDGMSKISSSEEIDIVVTSVVGMVGLIPTLSAIRSHKTIALANKETLVVAGELVMQEALKNGVSILPVDSEHSAVFQCIQGNANSAIDKIILTASGGPFRGKTAEELSLVTVGDALKHPNWSMGRKITIDSATLMNKGLEVIEAHWLFNKSFNDIKVVVHPQSIIHSMVEFCDGSIMAQLGSADMRLPIQYALNYPARKQSVIKRLDLTEVGNLTFEKPDLGTFKCLKLAYDAGVEGGLLPTILNGANEACVEMFLNNRISFMQIADIIEECMVKFDYNKQVSVENIIDLDSKVREYIIKKYN